MLINENNSGDFNREESLIETTEKLSETAN